MLEAKLKKMNFIGSLSIILMLVVGCAKDLEEKLPDNADRDIHPVSLFSETVKVKTVGSDEEAEGGNLFQVNAAPVERGLRALNEKKMRPVTFVSGNEKLAVLFKDLKVESSAKDEEFIVHFKLTDGRVSAFYEAAGHALSTTNELIATELKGKKVVPFFHYSGISYGRLKKRENSLDEETRFVDFEVTDRAAATHLRLTGTVESRNLDGLYGKEDSEVLLKEKINQQIWSMGQISELFNIETASTAQSALSRSGDVLKTVIADSKLYIYQVIQKSTLSDVELTALNALLENGRDGVVSKYLPCDASIQRRISIPLEDCALKVVLEHKVSHVGLELEKDNGVTVGSVEIIKGIDPSKSKLIEIPFDEKITISSFDRDLSIENDNFLDRENVDGLQISSSEAQTTFKLPELSSSVIQTKLIGTNLHILIPVKIEDLSLIEFEGFSNGDPRFESCDEEMLEKSGLSEDDCVLKTLYYRPATYANIRLTFDENSQEYKTELVKGVDRSSANLIGVDLETGVRTLNYDKLFEFSDEIITHKEQHFDTEAEYIYVPSVNETPRWLTQARPFQQGDEKVVKMRFTKSGLELYSEDKDERFASEINEKPVLKIPGAYLSFKCIEDDQGDCINQTIPATDSTWKEAGIFIPQLERTRVQEVNTLDLFNIESELGCIIPTDTRLVSHTIEKGYMNFVLERSYRVNSTSMRCLFGFFEGDFDDLSFKVKFNFSLARIKDLASPDYEVVTYPAQDHDIFGFFTDERKILNDNFDFRREKEAYRMNRWNPKKGKIVYHLSDTFNLPGQEVFKRATYDGIASINKSLKAANAGFEIELKEPSGKNASDLRNNVVQLITDPLNSGLLGYGPSVSNPKTGEIVQGRVNMYSGTLNFLLTQRVWENMVDLTKNDGKPSFFEFVQDRDTAMRELIAKANFKNNGQIEELVHQNGVVHFSNDNVEFSHMVNNGFFQQGQLAESTPWQQVARERSLTARIADLASRKENLGPLNYVEIDHVRRAEVEDENYRRRMNNMAEETMMTTDFFQIAHTAKKLIPGVKDIPGVLEKDGTLKRWDDLDRETHNLIRDKIMYHVYLATFVHEVGHNLGLRHNFQGSFDGENFYSEEEAAELGLSHPPAYSSIMDYAFSELNELTVFGKYDVAALRFAYAREVERPNGEFVKIPNDTSLNELTKADDERQRELDELIEDAVDSGQEEEAAALREEKTKLGFKEYMFCTDGNASLSATCNRQDEGTSLVEVTKYIQYRYEMGYRYDKFRDGRNVWTDTSVINSARWTHYYFNRMRDVFEEWEFFAGIFGEQVMVGGCTPQQVKDIPICKMVNDRRDAALLAGNFFLSVLRMPDHQCGVAMTGEPNTLVEAVSLLDIYEDKMKFQPQYLNYFPRSCFEPEVQEALLQDSKVAIAERGRFFNGEQGRHDIHKYTNDRMVIGSWIDKVVAMEMLTRREKPISLTERDQMAIVDHPEIEAKFAGLMRHLVLGTPLNNSQIIPLRTKSGQMISFPYELNRYLINSFPERVPRRISERYGIKHTSGAQTLLVEALLNTLQRYNRTEDFERKSKMLALHNTYAVEKVSHATPIDSRNTNLEIALGDNEKFVAHKRSNTAAAAMIEEIQAHIALANLELTREGLIAEVYEARNNPVLPDGLSDEEAFLLDMETGLIRQLIMLKRTDTVIPIELFIDNFGPDVGAMLYQAYTELTIEQMENIIEIKEGLGAPPADADEDTLRLYSFPLKILKDFLGNELEQRAMEYKNVMLPLLLDPKTE